jgi:methionyl-tRNA formyltransferase
VSIHRVDEGIDTGPAYLREWLEGDTVVPGEVESRLTALRGKLFARVIAALARGEAQAIDTFLEPSSMTRGMPLAERRELERELEAGRVLRAPADSSR